MKRIANGFFSSIGVITVFYLGLFYGLPMVLSELEAMTVRSVLRRDGTANLRGAMNDFKVNSVVTKESGRYIYRYSLGNATKDTIVEWGVLNGLAGRSHETLSIPAGKAFTFTLTSDWGPVVVVGELMVIESGKKSSGIMRMSALIPRWSKAHIPEPTFSRDTSYSDTLRHQMFEWQVEH